MTRRLEPVTPVEAAARLWQGYGRSGQARALYAAGASTYEVAVFLRLSHAYVRRAVRDFPRGRIVSGSAL
jgi:hypothetical protein